MIDRKTFKENINVSLVILFLLFQQESVSHLTKIIDFYKQYPAFEGVDKFIIEKLATASFIKQYPSNTLLVE